MAPEEQQQPPQGLVMPKNTVVSISGLKGRPDLNGRQGTIEDYNGAVGRYNVKVQKQVGEGFDEDCGLHRHV